MSSAPDDAIVVAMAPARARIDPEKIQLAVRRVRAQTVMVDADLAELYGVDVRVINQAVRRNPGRFPHDFMFTLTAAEAKALRSHSVILEGRRGAHRKYPTKAFTEEGVAMLSSVLRSPRAIRVNVEIMRAFVRLRRMLGASQELARKLEALERKYDGQFSVVFEAIRELMAPARSSR